MVEPDGRVFREEDLEFAFDAGWSMCRKWDEESVYVALRDQVRGSCGVDFVAVREQPRGLYLIEVKDYRTFEAHGETRKSSMTMV